MSDINVFKAHTLGAEAAAKALEKVLGSGKLPGLYSIDWSEDRRSARFKGSQYSGEVLIGDESVEIRMGLSFLAKAFKSQIEDKIEDALATGLG